MKSILVWIALVSVFLFSIISVSANELPTSFDPQRDPGKDLTLAIKIAGESGKNILIDVGGNWCIWCRIMENWLQENTDVENYLNDNYLLMKVNFSPENKNEKFLSQFPNISGYPHLFVLSPEGKLLHSQDTGLLENGRSYDKKKFLIFLKKWSPEKKEGF